MGEPTRTPPYAAAGPRPAFPSWRVRWGGWSPLAGELTAVLIVKALVLGLLWWAFFSSPAAPHMALEPQQVVQRILASPSPPEAPDAHR
jgi:hypothetical protein